MGSTSKLLVILKEVQKGQNPCTQGEYKWKAKLKKRRGRRSKRTKIV